MNARVATFLTLVVFLLLAALCSSGCAANHPHGPSAGGSASIERIYTSPRGDHVYRYERSHRDESRYITPIYRSPIGTGNVFVVE